MKREGKRMTLALTLGVALSCGLPTSAEANSGGVEDRPQIGDYTGGSGGVITASGGNIIIDMDVAGYIHGGYSAGRDASENNCVTMNGGKVTQIIYGGYSKNGEATNNHVIINDGIVEAEVFGGLGNAGATNNTVTIHGGRIDSMICGGGIALGNVGDTKNNTVTVDGIPTFGVNAAFIGGTSSRGNDNFSGNTLNWGTSGSVEVVNSFENYNFTIPGGANPGDSLLIINGGDKTNLANTKVKLLGVAGSRRWQKGESVILLDNPAGFDGNAELIEGKTTQGIKRYEYALAQDANSITATILKAGLGDQAKSLSEGRVAGLGFLNGAANLIAGVGMDRAMAESGKTAYNIFGVASYAGTKLDSGSQVDIRGSSLLVGASRSLKLDGNDWMLGMFIEGGKGSYDTYDNFEDAGRVHADGENKYWGVGLMARTTNKANVYTEGSLRVGRITTDYDSRDIKTKYDSGAVYYGAHLGFGKIIKINEKADLDIYGKYLWSKQNGDTINIDGENLNFDTLHSNRIRLGARINLKGRKGVTTYVGLAYEREFSANVEASAGGESVGEPSVKGGTGIGELGIQYKPKEDGAFSVSAGLNGYTGKREGIGGSFKFAWGF